MIQDIDLSKIKIQSQRTGKYRIGEVINLIASVLVSENAVKWYYYAERTASQNTIEDIFLSYFEENYYENCYSGLRKDTVDWLMKERTEWSDWNLRVENLWLAVGFEKKFGSRIDKDIEVLFRKRRGLIYVDEFGDEITDRWDNELNLFVSNKLSDKIWRYAYDNRETIENFLFNFDGRSKSYDEFLLGLSSYDYKVLAMMKGRMEEKEKEDSCFPKDEPLYPNTNDSDVFNQPALLVMSGHDYERYLALRVNNETTFHAEVTRGSGDQGADLIVRGIGLSAVIQTKLYNEKVGNKAIQEAFSARQFYGTGLAIVVANSGFTKSAWSLAERTGVLALHEEKFIQLMKVMGNST